MLTVALRKQIEADCPMVHQRRRHIPIRHYHAHMPAMFPKHRAVPIGQRLRVERAEKPIARLTHFVFAAQFVKFKDETGFFLFGH